VRASTEHYDGYYVDAWAVRFHEDFQGELHKMAGRNPIIDRLQITIWALCVVSTFFLGSRLAIRMSRKGRILVYDYFLIAALPMLFMASGLLSTHADPDLSFHGSTFRLTAAIEVLWIAIYCVKFCFLAQFKFYKPPYAYVNVHLTRYYWTTVCIYSAGFLFTIIQPIVLCPSSGRFPLSVFGLR
jgi:hypothetical protein